MRKINQIIIHCSATTPDMNIGAAEIRDWHVRGNGWSDIGYHYVIKRDGELEKGRQDDISGAHARGNNHDSLGICLVGGIDVDKNPDSNYTRDQWATLEVLVSNLKSNWLDTVVIGHRDLDGVTKECPCFDVKQWWGGK